MQSLAAPGITPAPIRRIDAVIERATLVFRDRIASFQPSRMIVFGSRALGDESIDSDADIAVVLRGESGDRWAVAREMARMAFDVLVETGVLIDPLPLWEGELEQPDQFINPSLLRTILDEGQPI